MIYAEEIKFSLFSSEQKKNINIASEGIITRYTASEQDV